MQLSIDYDQTVYQDEFHNSNKRYVYLSTGFGGGKTYALCMKGIQLAALNSPYPGGCVAPTLKMFKKDVLPTYQEIGAESGLKVKFSQYDSTITFPQLKTKQYIFHGEDHGQSIRGPNLSYMLMNEAPLISKATFDAAVSRVRIKKAPKKQIALSGTPEGFNWAYDFFVVHPREDTDLIFGDARQNTYIDPQYFQMLVESYDDKMVEQYVKGRFVNLTGDRAAWAFDRNVHCNASIKKVEGAPTWVSLDFNVGVMAATLWNRVPANQFSGVELLGYKSIGLTNSNTMEMCQALKEKLDVEKEQIVIYPDPAGASRSTKSYDTTDMDILREAGFTDIRYRSRISSVRDCLNALNGKLSKNRIAINASECHHLVADLEQCIIKQGTDFVIDKSNPKRTHWLDGFKDMVEYEFPIKGIRQARQWKYL